MNSTLRLLLTAPASQLDPSMVKKLQSLEGKSDKEVKTGLHEILDRCVYSSLASDFVVRILQYEWQQLGGKSDDPAPWRDELK